MLNAYWKFAYLKANWSIKQTPYCLFLKFSWVHEASLKPLTETELIVELSI